MCYDMVGYIDWVVMYKCLFFVIKDNIVFCWNVLFLFFGEELFEMLYIFFYDMILFDILVDGWMENGEW